MDIDTFKCEYCDRGHPSKEALRKHLSRCTHKPKKEEKLEIDNDELVIIEQPTPSDPRPKHALDRWRYDYDQKRARMKELVKNSTALNSMIKDIEADKRAAAN